MINHKSISNKLYTYWKNLGPGLITGASDDDPSGIATYSQAGAAFGFSTLWTALLTFPLMAAIQEMCARIGIVTGEGLTGTIKRHYSKSLLYVMILFSFPAITLNIGADIQGMGAVAHLLFPQIRAELFCIFFTLMLIFFIVRFPYRKLAAALKWLCLSLLLYIIVPFMVHINWLEVIKCTFIPEFHFNKLYFEILVGILGTTISPYLFFWQANMEVEDVAQKKQQLIVNKFILKNMKKDVDIGMLFSNIVMFFIILTTGDVLFKAGIFKIDTVEQAALALKPLAGNFTYILFAIGIIGTGLLAIPVLGGALSYIFSETFGWIGGLDKKFSEAPWFYIVLSISLIIGLSLNYFGISPVQALIYSAVLYGLTAPVLIAIILHICNNKSIMGEFTNKRYANFMGFLTLIIMSLSSFGLIYLLF